MQHLHHFLSGMWLIIFLFGSGPSLIVPNGHAAAKRRVLRQPAAPIVMVSYDDPWPLAMERWWDMASYRDNGRDYYNQYNEWLTDGKPNGKFDYRTRARGVTLTYDKKPADHYFVGHISAKGLKPNFTYQIKLAGKPVSGTRGFGTASSYVSVTSKTQKGRPTLHVVKDAKGQVSSVNGDDWTNQQLGYRGRWWNDSNPANNTNAIRDIDYQQNTTDTIYGYIFIGDFVTDKQGNAEWDIVDARSYHVTWQDGQEGAKHVPVGRFNIAGATIPGGTTGSYGYGPQAPSSGIPQQNGKRTTSLFYEWEWDRQSFVRLPKGTYHCRLLITEETFHNSYIYGTDNPLGGRWKTVMSTENFPDTDSANDIVFTVS